jgi:acetyltransferase-like isoleucine patch superfamily enzyme
MVSWQCNSLLPADVNKKDTEKMIKLLNKIVSGIKGELFTLDSGIPLGYLIRLIISRLLMLIRGFFTFCRSDGFFFRDRNTVIKAKSLIRLGRGVSIGRNCYIDALSSGGINIGNNVSIGKNTTIECSGSINDIGIGLKIGDGAGLGTNGFFGCAGGVEIGENTIFGNFVSIHSENHNYSDLNTPIRLQGVERLGIKIGANCWIGAKVSILDGAHIKNGCIIAAGSVVTKGIYDSNCIYVGVPAKLLKKR